MRLSVVIPSRLQVLPKTLPSANLWKSGFFLERAIASVRSQDAGIEIEILVGLDHGVTPPHSLCQFGVKWAVPAKGISGQAASLNAAASLATGDVIAFLEDDDVWAPAHIGCGLRALDRFSFVSAVQDLIDEGGAYLGTNDYPIPSTWVMRHGLWKEIGPFDPSYRYHMDSEWLGRINQTAHLRCHLVERTADLSLPGITRRPDLLRFFQHAPKGSSFGRLPYDTPLVTRLQNLGGGMVRILIDKEANARSSIERGLLEARFANRMC